MTEQDSKMTSGEEKVIYRGNKTPTPDTRLPEDVERCEEVEESSTVRMVDHVVSQEDLDLNPELVAEGVQVGDTIQLPVETDPDKIAALEEEMRKEGGLFGRVKRLLGFN